MYMPHLHDLRHKVDTIVMSVIPDIPTRVWEELNYRSDVSRLTKDAHTFAVCVVKTGKLFHPMYGSLSYTTSKRN